MLLPPERLGPRLRALAGPAPVVELIDLGVPFQVVVAGRVREYRDERRDCTHRARVAAVFVALTIDPASIAMPPLPPPPVTVSEAAPASAPPARARLDVGGRARRGRGNRRSRRAPGRGRAAGARPRAHRLRRGRERAAAGRHQRRRREPAPVAAAVRRRASAPASERAASRPTASSASAPRSCRRPRAISSSADSRTGIELGARAAVGVRVGASRFAPFAALHAELIPSPAEIYALPRGAAGHTPYLWLGASAGASLELAR